MLAVAAAAVVDGDVVVVAKAAASSPFVEDVVVAVVVVGVVDLSSADFSRQPTAPASPLAGVDEPDRRRRPEVKIAANQKLDKHISEREVIY